MKDLKKAIELMKSRKELLEKINSSTQKRAITGYEIASLINTFLEENQVDSYKSLIKLLSQAQYEGNNKPSFFAVRDEILKLKNRIKQLEDLSSYTIVPPRQLPLLEAKLEIILKIKDLLSEKAPGYKIVALIDSYSTLIDINSFLILSKKQNPLFFEF